jgi:hypothetical protein
MEYFYGSGGNPDPYFRFRFKVKVVDEELYDWCESYPESGPFSRWHVEWKTVGRYRHEEYDIIQFELEAAAKAFALLFGDYLYDDGKRV